MATQRGQVQEGRLERQRTGFLQRSQSRQAGSEGSPARGRQTPRLFLRPYGRYEEEANKREDGQRPELPHKQEPSGLELLI